MKKIKNKEKAILGGGCFWCIEAFFYQLTGVNSVISGYAGGTTKNPTYEQVSSGSTGHAEVIQIKFDPNIISYKTLLDVFWKAHDPTTLNRQGQDIGTQYRSIILYVSEEQKKIAEESIKKADESGFYKNKIVTEIKSLEKFYKAEKYHQNFYQKNPKYPYCSMVIAPKIKKLKKEFSSLLKAN